MESGRLALKAAAFGFRAIPILPAKAVTEDTQRQSTCFPRETDNDSHRESPGRFVNHRAAS
ncbi:hypothetical protein GCM10023329_30010 [Streptomyces sanyensis]|uniref:Uncharacterized protein n=1 Tax=Streptomyces sanyensis TaxID=568869 RepID=A0ABP9ACF1_9ACTN